MRQSLVLSGEAQRIIMAGGGTSWRIKPPLSLRGIWD
jgi:hypothetical protein